MIDVRDEFEVLGFSLVIEEVSTVVLLSNEENV